MVGGQLSLSLVRNANSSGSDLKETVRLAIPHLQKTETGNAATHAGRRFSRSAACARSTTRSSGSTASPARRPSALTQQSRTTRAPHRKPAAARGRAAAGRGDGAKVANCLTLVQRVYERGKMRGNRARQSARQSSCARSRRRVHGTA